MYDILQLNDMIVPELLDIAEQLKIPNAKKLDKQGLVYKILDKQAITASDKTAAPVDDKPKRKRIIKTTTANSTEEAIVESGDEKPAPPKPDAKKQLVVKAEKPAPKKPLKKKADIPQQLEKMKMMTMTKLATKKFLMQKPENNHIISRRTRLLQTRTIHRKHTHNNNNVTATATSFLISSSTVLSWPKVYWK
jgi:hypothetical protein